MVHVLTSRGSNSNIMCPRCSENLTPTREQTPDLRGWCKCWWRVIGRASSTPVTRSSYSEETRARYDGFFRSFAAPPPGPTPSKSTPPSPASFLCNDNTPVKIASSFKSAGEIPVQPAIEAPITPDLPWSRKNAEPLLRPSRSIPRDPQRTHTSFLSTLPVRDTLDAIQEKVAEAARPPTPSCLEARMIGTVESPSRVVFYSQRTASPVINTPSPPVVIDILSNGLRVTGRSGTESLLNIRTFMHSSSRIAAARNLRGKAAQGLIDLIDQVSGT